MPTKYKLLSELINDERQVKPIPSRVDYNFCNYCSTCALKFPKNIVRCDECKQKLRTKPWHRSKKIERKRI